MPNLANNSAGKKEKRERESKIRLSNVSSIVRFYSESKSLNSVKGVLFRCFPVSASSHKYYFEIPE